MRALDAEAVMDGDGRRPILYLRSFTSDGSIVSRGSEVFGTELLPTTLEERLCDVLKDSGPVVAIGKPGEAYPELGASRAYVDDDAWQETVLHLMRKSQLVVFRAGESGGFWWEVQVAVREVRPQNLLVFLPYEFPTERSAIGSIASFSRTVRSFLSTSAIQQAEVSKRQLQYSSFRARAQGYFPRELPKTIG